MKGYEPESYGDSYDDYEAAHSNLLPDPTPMVDVLARYAGTGRALEIGIGSGRVARPLAERGVRVDGIEISPKMIEQLRKSADGLPIRVFRGSCADLDLADRYSLIYCAVSTFFCLPTREEQERTFGTVAGALDGDGVCILDVYTPDPERFHANQEFKVLELSVDSATLQFSLHHPDRQVVETQRLIIDAGGTRLHPSTSRYAAPEELDEMASAAGLRLRSRWADWSGSPFTARSPRHVSMYELSSA